MPRTLPRLVLLVAAAFATVSTAGSLTAHADPPADESQDEGHLAYPATAAAFREHVAERITSARARLEKHIADNQVPAPKADVMRARFQSAIATLNAKVDEVCADGTVTHDEAVAVHDLAKQLRRHAKPS
jgi:hypothetical protein